MDDGTSTQYQTGTRSFSSNCRLCLLLFEAPLAMYRDLSKIQVIIAEDVVTA
jgi:hypothetical protein